jgi:hypothetical protein
MSYPIPKTPSASGELAGQFVPERIAGSVRFAPGELSHASEALDADSQ